MVTPTCCAPSEAGSRRYSRPCPPYSFTYSDRRQQYSFHDNRTIAMADRDDSDQPRKRIAVACGRCRKRKIRCSGDPGNGGPCSNCKSAGYEPCLFLRVSSTERHFKESDYTYNLDAARLAHHGGGAMSPLASIPQYAYDVGAADGLTSYRQSTYPYGSNGSTKHYYSTSAMPAWSSAYADDSTSNVDYSYYSSHPLVSPESSSFMPGYSQQYNTRRSVYADPEASTYPPYPLAHRPAVSSDSQGFSLSSIAASLPNASDRLQSHANRTLTSSSAYRTDATPAQYATASVKTSSSAAASLSDIAYSNSNLHPSFESPYSTTGALASPISHRTSTHTDYGTSSGATAADHHLYTAGEPSVRSAEDTTGAVGYMYSDTVTATTANHTTTTNNHSTSANHNKMIGSSSSGSRRDSHNSHNSSAGVSAAGSLLANGHVYVPDSHSAHPTPHPYVLSSSTSSGTSHSHSQGRSAAAAVDNATAPAAGSRGSGGISPSGSSGSSSHHHHHHNRSSESQRRCAGTHRGG